MRRLDRCELILPYGSRAIRAHHLYYQWNPRSDHEIEITVLGRDTAPMKRILPRGKANILATHVMAHVNAHGDHIHMLYDFLVGKVKNEGYDVEEAKRMRLVKETNMHLPIKVRGKHV